MPVLAPQTADLDRVFSVLFPNAKLPRPVAGALGHMLQLERLRAIHDSIAASPGRNRFLIMLTELNVRTVISSGDLARILPSAQ
ncbi:MAG: hypothetical protein WKF37_16620 [Bryobacteraceae bacterium]